MNDYLETAATQEVPQSEALTPEQVVNQAGGYVYKLDKWSALDRFLILGTEGGSYYASERKATWENTKNLDACIAEDGERVLRAALAISDSGRAAKNDPAIFALARVLTKGTDRDKALAIGAVPGICRIGTHIFMLARYLKAQRGTGRVFRKAIAAWYKALEENPEKLAYQLIKYRQRDGWTHGDLLRVSHPKFADPVVSDLVGYLALGAEAERYADFPNIVRGYDATLRGEDDPRKRSDLIADFNLPREALPTEWLKDVSTWKTLLTGMPIGALIRNLGVMTANGTLKPLGPEVNRVVERLGYGDKITQSRVHPIQVLAALTTYAQGRGARGSLSWDPISQIEDALDEAFYLAFDNVEPTNKRTLLALDVSGSMGYGTIAGVPGLTPRVGAAAMAMVTARTEPNYNIVAFSHQMVPVTIGSKDSLADVTQKTARIRMGGTDCALPMLYALENKIEVDTFVVYTDNETWYGEVHPARALQKYREKMGIPAKLAVVGMTATDFTIADPADAGMMDFVGFDTATPQAISEFATL